MYIYIYTHLSLYNIYIYIYIYLYAQDHSQLLLGCARARVAGAGDQGLAKYGQKCYGT